MHRSESGDDAQAPKGAETVEGWFRFGDEPAGAETTDAKTAGNAGENAVGGTSTDMDPGPSSRSLNEDDDGGSSGGLVAGERGEGAMSAAGADDAFAAETAADAPADAAMEAEPEERIAPFVVSATPGGVDPDAATIVPPSDSGRGGFGLVGALTVMLALFGVGMFAISAPRTADAELAGSGGVWMSDVGEAMRLAEAGDKPLLVHFTADWCPPCQAMRDAVFSSRVVQERLARDFITVRVDLTERGGANDRIAQEFNVRSIPDLQVYHPGGWQLGQFGYAGSVGEFLNHLEAAVR